MPGIKSFILNQPSEFFKETLKATDTVSLKYGDIEKSNAESTSSFKYDFQGAGIKSTQQIPLDWSKFENHTFFNSAQGKTNVAFDKIINGYPFDGTRKETEAFLESLSGFEKYVYDQFPKNKGYLLFTASHISVADRAGTDFPTLSRTHTGKSVLDPGNSSFTYELQLFLPAEINEAVQVVCQKISGSMQGISLLVSSSLSAETAPLNFLVSSGSITLSASANIIKGKFNHIVATLDRTKPIHRAELYVNELLGDQSANIATIGAMDFINSPLTIGSGSTITAHNADIAPTQTLSGGIDELRVFHDIRTINQQKLFAQKAIFTDDTLKLYYKFNEPTGTLGDSASSTINQIVLDSSGNSLHSSITNFNFSLRNTSSLGVPLVFEKLEFTPVLFPSYQGITGLNTSLLATASLYDDVNPNLITRLVPAHYFTEGQVQEGLTDVDGTINNDYEGTSIPGSGKLGSVQLLTSLLFVYAKFFDELKIVVDSFSTVLYADYQKEGFIPDSFLTFLANYYGFKIPNMFSQATVEQYIEAENITQSIETSKAALRTVQNELLRRVLTDIQNVIKSKGTVYSVKSLIRSLGIDPDSSLRIREFGGPQRKQIGSERELRAYVAGMLNMSSSQCFISSSYLSGSRVEVGYPEVQGSLVNQKQFPPHGISNAQDDGLFTSGSWTYEAFYKFSGNRQLNNLTQSLVRLESTGSSAAVPVPPVTPQPIVNLVALSSSNPTLKLFIKPSSHADDDGRLLTMQLTGANIFDGELWSVSFGRYRNDSINSLVSSSYFLRCARQGNGEIKELFATSSYFQESIVAPTNDIFQDHDNSYNDLGLFVAVGSQSLDVGASTTTYKFLNNTAELTNEEVRAVTFDGKISNIRFWSKPLEVDEWKEHVRNRQSLGVNDPLKNFNFEKTASGSFERLRMNLDITQETTQSSDVGAIKLFDFSQNFRTANGINFVPDKQVINKELVRSTFLSPYFDEMVVSNKVRIRSLQNSADLVNFQYAEVAPVYELQKSEEVHDDPRFTIDFSIVDALNRDIINVFATLDALDNMLGDPTLLFSSDYPDMIQLRDIYFNRLTEKIKLNEFFTVFKWFDTLINSFLKELMPKKTRFLGANFVMEAHMLERSRIRYLYSDQYLDEKDRALPPNIQSLDGTVGGSSGGTVE